MSLPGAKVSKRIYQPPAALDVKADGKDRLYIFLLATCQEKRMPSPCGEAECCVAGADSFCAGRSPVEKYPVSVFSVWLIVCG